MSGPFWSNLDDFVNASKAIIDAADIFSHVYYGDEPLTPTLPCALIDDFRKDRSLNKAQGAATHLFAIDFYLYITILFGRVDEPGEFNQQQAVRLSEATEKALHADHTMGGNVIFSTVTRTETGRTRLASVVYRSARITFEAMSREQF